MNYSAVIYKIKKQSIPIIKDKLKDICIHISNDCLNLPSMNEYERYCDFSPPARKIYDKMKKDKIIEIKRNIDTHKKSHSQNFIISVGNIMSSIWKLRQICSGFIYGEETAKISNHKIDMLVDILNETNENVLIACTFKESIRMISEAIKGVVVFDKTQKQIDLWNSGKIKHLVCNPASCSHGLNLQFGGRNIIWYEPTYSLDVYMQFNARLHRNGQKKSVNIIRLLTKNTIEANMLNIIKKKGLSLDDFLNSM